ncbi:MAG: hypothetical protein M1836_001518 [Candelina mexicana]|nr:MAG: hypothetical protein M1836_001518 [Candelina mexicana]
MAEMGQPDRKADETLMHGVPDKKAAKTLNSKSERVILTSINGENGYRTSKKYRGNGYRLSPSKPSKPQIDKYKN